MFPVTQLPLYAGIAPGADPANPAAWNFTDITSDVRESGGVEIQVGRQDETSLVDATRMQMIVDNRDGDYSRVNPLGTWYGQLDKGTPIEARITRINDHFTRTVASGLGTDSDSGLAWNADSTFSVSSNAARAALAAANSITLARLPDAAADDAEVSTVASLGAVTTGANWVHGIMLRYTDDNNFYRMHTEFDTSGVIGVKIMKRLAGVSTTVAALTLTTVAYSGGTLIHTRARAVGTTLQIRVWADGNAEPSTWHLTAEDTDLIGQAVGLYEWRVSGNTNVGTLTCTIDDFRMDAIRASTPVPEWPVRWDTTGTNVTTPITGAGPLRRLSQGSSALRSPIYRQLIGQDGCGYWPLEDSSDATSGANAIAGGPAAVLSDGSFGSTDCPAGASSALTLNTVGTSRIVGRIDHWTVAQDGYAAMIYFKLPTLPGGTAVKLFEINARGTVARWVISINNASFTIDGFDASGTSAVAPPAVLYTPQTPLDWMAIRLEAVESGGTVNWEFTFYQVGDPSFVGLPGSYAGTADLITSVAAYAPVASTLVSHMWAGDDTLDFVDTTFIKVSTGYAGEAAADRLARLATEEGVKLRPFGDTADSALMGVQRAATFLDLARECEAADQGLLFEAGAGLGYLTRVFRQNPDVTMALDFNSGHVAAPPEPTDDDQRLRNQIRLSRTGGSEVTVQDDASIAKSGVYSDELTVNLLADGFLEDHAAWRLHLGTLDDLRWPRIQLNLAKATDLIADWCKVRVGSRITLTNPPDAVQGKDLDLIVEGWTETLGPYSWDVVLACSPAQPWRVGLFDTSTSLATSYSTTLHCGSGGINSSATAVIFATENPKDVWSTTNEPYDVEITGEQITVTAMGAADHDAALIQGTFEAGVTGWSAFGGTSAIAQSNTFAFSGTFSARLTVAGSPTQAYIRPDFANCPPVIPGLEYTAAMQCRTTSTLTVQATIDWLDANGAFLSNSSSGGSLASGAFAARSVTATAPAGAAYAQYGSTIIGSPANGSVLYTDAVTFTATTVSYQDATVTRSVNGIAKSHSAGEAIDLRTPVYFGV